MPSVRTQRLLIIGLDCAAPRFCFDRDGLPLPNLHALMDRGLSGVLRSCDPPITVPAWSCMTTGRDPGELGIYGFRNRRDRSYTGMRVSTARDVAPPRLWDYVGGVGGESIVVGVPQTYPPVPVRGCMVAGVLTPGTSAAYTWPPELAREIARNVGEYRIDVSDFRTEDKQGLIARIDDVRENRFDLAEYLMRTRPWRLCMLVDIALDRLHHAFWQFADSGHPQFRPGNPHAHVIADYYRALDKRIGRLVDRAGPDTAILIVSDHGARALQGGFAINQWLLQEGYLTLLDTPETPAPLEPDTVDWARTVAWSEGGYYARIFMNVQDREPEGAVPAHDYHRLRDELAERIAAIPGPRGVPLGNRVLKPEQIYATVQGVAPDLLVYLGDLDWRSVGRVGGPMFWTGNDTGPDGANHDPDGVFVLSGIEGLAARSGACAHLLDVLPTALAVLGIPAPPGLRGVSLLNPEPG